MTENEAIKVMKWYSEEEYGKGLVSESHKMAIQALEEIQSYRAIGLTPELIEAMQGHNIALINDLGEYQQIGTIDEFKSLKEKLEKIEFILTEKDYPNAQECDYGNYYTCENALMIKDIEEILET